MVQAENRSEQLSSSSRWVCQGDLECGCAEEVVHLHALLLAGEIKIRDIEAPRLQGLGALAPHQVAGLDVAVADVA
jgi:hypothetical protein